MRMRRCFHIEVRDEALLDVDEIWPDGDAPENPTTEDVIEQIKKTSNRSSFMVDWGFEQHVTVDGEPVW